MRIYSTWDSIPVSIYAAVEGYEVGTVREVPEEVYRRYERAQNELQTAENALAEYFKEKKSA